VGDTEKENNQKKPAHPGKKLPERLALNSPFHIPLEERLAFFRLASHHSGSLVNDGGGLLRTHKYHMEKGCQEALFHLRI